MVNFSSLPWSYSEDSLSSERSRFMTTEEIKTVSDLQNRGLGYKKIASVTGLPINTVKSFIRRNRVPVQNQSYPQAFCRGCGKPIDIIPKQKPRQFCSDACRMRWWNQHPDNVKRRAWYTFICPSCGKDFSSYGNSNRKYCSRACVAAARRKRGDGCDG